MVWLEDPKCCFSMVPTRKQLKAQTTSSKNIQLGGRCFVGLFVGESEGTPGGYTTPSMLLGDP